LKINQLAWSDPEGFTNQLGVVSTGTIDVRDLLKPKITLTSDNGITITNILDGGRKMKKEFLPKVDLGRLKIVF